jgi:peptidyl-prolyl cis-trans isomerase D
MDYMKKKPKKFKADETREVEYVLIEDKASAEDEAVSKPKQTDRYLAAVIIKQQGKNDTFRI